ncbi:hypothetical protein CDAR_603471 [Caerostris darwini]|uniref:Uncharacterized protein n=1 Tax=Caerostris darwini TaxID=1538125 RepID=A0AAV4T5Y7_9ARAC|nr:hypothetical protein CDAR_603471 [Caerostris darwini]
MYRLQADKVSVFRTLSNFFSNVLEVGCLIVVQTGILFKSPDYKMREKKRTVGISRRYKAFLVLCFFSDELSESAFSIFWFMFGKKGRGIESGCRPPTTTLSTKVTLHGVTP